MHGTNTRPSHSERSSGMPRMWWPLIAAIAATSRSSGHPTTSREAAGAPKAAAVCPAAAQRRAGRQLVRPWCTRLPRCVRSRRSAKASSGARPCLDIRGILLCHAWDDRQGAAKQLHDLLESLGVSVWFSEKDVSLGTPLLREIDKGLAKSRVGIVLVTPTLLRRLSEESIVDKELSALLARDQLVPIVHDTTYDALREVSPLLGSRTGLSTAEDTMADIAAKLAEFGRRPGIDATPTTRSCIPQRVGPPIGAPSAVAHV